MRDTNSIQSGWTSVRLGDVGQWYGGGTPSKFEPRYWTKGTIPWVSPKDMKSLHIIDSEDHLSQSALDETNVREFPRGTVLLVIRSGILSRTLPVGVAEVSGTMNQDLKGVRPAKGIESMFLAYQLIGREREVLKKCSKHGTTVASIDTERLHDFEIRLAPPPEQRRIVAKIEELFSDLDAGVAALKRVRANLKRYRAAVLKAAVEGRLTEEWRARNPAAEPAAILLERILAERRAKWEQDQLRRFKEAGKTPPKGWKDKYESPAGPTEEPPDDLPATWSWCTIEQAAADLPRAIQSGPFGSNLLHSEFQESGVLAIGIDNVQSGRFSLGSGHRISDAKFEKLQKYEARPLDFLITVMATVGRCCVVPADLERAIITKHVYRVSLESRLINAYFLQSAVLGGPVVKRQIFGEVRGQTRPGINGEILRQVAVPIPPLAEQAEIVAEVDRRLSVADAAEKEVEHALQRAARLRQAILKRAFEGRLVPQDPTDKPAAALFERIKPAGGANAKHAAAARPATRRSRARV